MSIDINNDYVALDIYDYVHYKKIEKIVTNRKIFLYLRKLKDSNRHYLYNSSMFGIFTIYGVPLYINKEKEDTITFYYVDGTNIKQHVIF